TRVARRSDARGGAQPRFHLLLSKGSRENLGHAEHGMNIKLPGVTHGTPRVPGGPARRPVGTGGLACERPPRAPAPAGQGCRAAAPSGSMSKSVLDHRNSILRGEKVRHRDVLSQIIAHDKRDVVGGWLAAGIALHKAPHLVWGPGRTDL